MNSSATALPSQSSIGQRKEQMWSAERLPITKSILKSHTPAAQKTDEFQSSYRQRSVVAKPEETKMTITQPDQPEVKETSLDRHFDKP